MAEINEKLNIPDKIKVGFQERSDTYTGKLSYITYINKKGKLAKEISWEGWRDKKITPLELDNVPTEGFVLNKKAGGYSTGWNHRQTYCRVYDPRDFEFEINIENLLYILQECTSSKGKGLEGKFVYAWSGKDLVLLPVDSLDYKMSKQLIDSTEKITMKSLKIGASYKGKVPNSKDISDNLVYIGKMTWHGFAGMSIDCNDYNYNYKLVSKVVPTFVDINKKHFYGYSSLTSLYHLVNENTLSLSEVEDYKEKFLHTFHGEADQIDKLFIVKGSRNCYSDVYGYCETLYETEKGEVMNIRIDITRLLNNKTWGQLLYTERKNMTIDEFNKKATKKYKFQVTKVNRLINDNKEFECQYKYAQRESRWGNYNNGFQEFVCSEKEANLMIERMKYHYSIWVKMKNGDKFPMQYDYRNFSLIENFK